jgi:hypothetical protein
MTYQSTTVEHVAGHVLLLHEDLARSRMRELERDAAERRLARRLHTERRGRRVARWAAKRADHAASSL